MNDDQDVLSLIRQARERKARWLNLSNRKLTALPPELFELTELRVLWLENNQLTELPPEIGQLTQLRRLRLTVNRLSALPAALGELRELQELHLADNHLTELPDSFAELIELREFDLRANLLERLPDWIGNFGRLKKLWIGTLYWGKRRHAQRGKGLTELPPAVAQLTNLQTLSLDSNQLTELPPAVAQLTNLQKLWLSSNQLTELPLTVAQLSHLQKLDLSRNQLTALPPALAQLSNLQTLSLDSNQLTELPPALAQLTNLQSLWLNSNQLTELPPAVAQLTNLQKLDLSRNQLTELPPAVAQLTNLQTLYLSSNQLTELPPAVAQLTNLQHLDLRSNQLTELPPAVAQLTNLQTLYLDGNQLTALPPALAQLTNLQTLNLSGNQLTALPPALAQLTNLQTLNLSGNQLTALPPALAQLTNLQFLNLSSNQLTALPPALAQLTNLQSVRLSGNDNCKCPPPEIIEAGWGAVKEFLLEELETVWVSKLLIVGEGGVGKTNLLRVLRDGPAAFVEGSETTHGMEIGALSLAHPDQRKHPAVTLELNTWDFGGQQIYHATHQFFLTQRSLYLIVWNARLGYEQNKLNYWLDTITLNAPDSPILLIATHTDERGAELPLAELRDKYPMIAGHFAVSSKTGEGLDALKAAIAEQAAALPLMGEKWPRKWLAVKDALRARAAATTHITPRELTRVMEDGGVTGHSAQVLARFLHELGEILYFRDVEELKKIVLLNPQWVTQVISRVLEDQEVKANQAIFTPRHMQRLWHEVDDWMCDVLIELMERFDLSYKTPESPDKSLVVELLPSDEAAYHARWEAIRQTDNCREITMKFRLDKTLPAGIPTWFIARQHRFTTDTHWRYGVLFADEAQRHLALVRAHPHDRYVQLTVRGPLPQNFFAKLCDGLELTFARFAGLEASLKRMIPCPGHAGVTCEYEFELEDLEKRLTLKPPRLTMECPKGFDNMQVRALLDGIWTPGIEERLEKLDQLDQVAADVSLMRLEIKELSEMAQREFTKQFNAEQARDDSYCPYIFVVRDYTGERELTGLLEPIPRASLVDEARAKLWKRRLELQLYCHEPGHWHPVGCERGKDDAASGLYQLEVVEFLRALAPHLSKLGKLMKYALPLIGLGSALALTGEAEKQFHTDIQNMTKHAEKLPAAFDEARESKLARDLEPFERAEGSALRQLRALLKQKDEAEIWGHLTRYQTKEGHWLWLCKDHLKTYR